ncbi:MAG: serine hydrolase domain-containing protein [Pseudomonadota bacterium]
MLTLIFSVFIAFGIVHTANAEGEASGETFTEIDELFEDALLDVKAPGLVYGVIVDGEVKRIKSFGIRERASGSAIDGDTAFRIASMTKMMTALLIMDLQHQGKLSLDQPAELYVPELKSLKYPTTDSRKITIRDMLNHTAGFVWDDPWADRQMHRSNADLDVFLKNAEPFSFAPGTTYEYSNLGYVILGRIIENVSGQSFESRLSERIFEPLGMNDSRLEVSEYEIDERAIGYNWFDNAYSVEPVLASGSFDPLGGVWTTANDYSKFIAWFLSAWPARDSADHGPIPRGVVRSVTDGTYLRGTSRRSGLAGQDDCLMSSAYGMGLHIHYHCDAGLLLRHGGGFPGFGSHVIMMPEKGIAVFAFANRTYAQMYVPVWDSIAALVDEDAGENIDQLLPADPRLIAAYEGIGRAFAEGRITGGNIEFENNFFLDRSEKRWDSQLDSIKEVTGACDVSEPFSHDGRLSGAFVWDCERARVRGYMTVSPVDPSRVQMLHLRAITRDSNGRDVNYDFNWH